MNSACPACQSGRITPFLDLGQVPVFCNVQWASRDEALQAASGPLALTACLECGHVRNASFDAALAAYAPGYENSQHASSVFRDYAQRLVDRLIARYGIRGKKVVDIGCGRGDLLALLCERGNNRGHGFDPSYAGVATPSAGRPFVIEREYFAPHHAAAIRPALISCRHVLEHIENPVEFLRSLRECLEQAGPDAVLYLEVPSGEQLLSALGLWDYLYEHVSYFTAQSLQAVLHAAGLEVLAVQRDFGGQFLCAEARISRTAAARVQPLDRIAETTIRSAANAMLDQLQRWRRWAAAIPAGGRVTLWGAGSKGVMFLNLLGLGATQKIPSVVDQNSDKHGRFVSGTGQEIVAPEALRGSAVDSVVLMNGIYESEVRSRLASLGVAPQLIVAWP